MVTLAFAGPPTRGVVSYGRSASSGATWSQRVRISPRSHVATSAVVSAAGRYVYVAWLRRNWPQKCESRISRRGGSGCAVYVRVNDDYGRSSAWSPVRRFSPPKPGIFTGMSIAATGSSVFVAVSATWRATVWTSRDHGSQWAGRRIGRTGDSYGSTALAAHKSLVVLAWRTGTDTGVGVSAKISRDGGRHWSATHAAGVSQGQAPSAAAIDGRVVIAGGYYSDSKQGLGCMWVQEWRHGKWRKAVNVFPHGASPYAEDVQLHGDQGIGLAYAAQLPPWDGDGRRLGVMWQTSADGGRTWTDGFEVERTPILPTPPYKGPPWFSLSAVWRPSGAVHVLSSLGVYVPRDVMSTTLRSRA